MGQGHRIAMALCWASAWTGRGGCRRAALVVPRAAAMKTADVKPVTLQELPKKYKVRAGGSSGSPVSPKRSSVCRTNPCRNWGPMINAPYYRRTQGVLLDQFGVLHDGKASAHSFIWLRCRTLCLRWVGVACATLLSRVWHSSTDGISSGLPTRFRTLTRGQ